MNDNDPTAEQVMRLQMEFMRIGELSVWPIYDHPSDYPDNWVARAFTTGPTDHIILATSLEQLQNIFDAAGLVKVMRNPNDDPKIVEIWL